MLPIELLRKRVARSSFCFWSVSSRPTVGLVTIFLVNDIFTIGGEIPAPDVAELPMLMNAIAEKLKSKDEFKGRDFEA
jgi:hypothetical protein